MKYTFLHLSDLHFRPNWPEEIGLVCDTFLQDLRTQSKRFGNVYMLFSGDVAFDGEKTTYATALESFDRQLAEIGISKEKRFVVPGNHDVCRGRFSEKLFLHEGFLKTDSDETLFNDCLPQLSETILAAKFDHYRDFERTFAKHTCCTTALGGHGWKVSEDLSVYCLNTALCSSAGLRDRDNHSISDHTRLLVDTRSLHAWLATNKSRVNILLMHHPIDWLAGWARTELERIIRDNFCMVVSGHVHENSAIFSSAGAGGVVTLVAPPLFTRKRNLLGYSFISLDTDPLCIDVHYRQWTPNHSFVTGTALANNDSGSVVGLGAKVERYADQAQIAPQLCSRDTLGILQLEFERASTCYSSKKRAWVDRDLSFVPETQADDSGVELFTQDKLIEDAPVRSRVIKAPMQFGLSCLARYLALLFARKSESRSFMVVLDAMGARSPYKDGVLAALSERCGELKINRAQIGGIILDNWQPDKHGRRFLTTLRQEFPDLPLLLMHSLDDCARISDAIEAGADNPEVGFETVYVWSLSRVRIRELVKKYIDGSVGLDDDLVTKKIAADLDALNIHRSPLNCLLLLKLTEQAFDDSPVNRTEVIGRVLYLLFVQFDKIPTYAIRPDLKDCEYALGYFCEWLLREGRTRFTKKDFYRKVDEYCSQQMIELDTEVLFSFLVSENIFLQKGQDFEFRFLYWLYYFAAHRMHHDAAFSAYIFENRRYAAYPELLEFYAGIDRRRLDAITKVTEDLKAMNAAFLERTGIAPDFNPMKDALWKPTQEALDLLQKEVSDGMAASCAPDSVKDAVADVSYDRAKPYKQELAQFIDRSSLDQMVDAMRGASRALRNSDHVLPEAKTALLHEVMDCWVRVCQIIVVISPALALEKSANFDGVQFYLDRSFDKCATPRERWMSIMNAIVVNVVHWYQDDIFSRKMGPLLMRYARQNRGQLRELLLMLVMVKQRPLGWDKEVERFVVEQNKNSFYLLKVFNALRHEHKFGYTSERSRLDLRRLAGMAIAKNSFGAKHPSPKLVETAAQQVIDGKSTSSQASKGRSQFF